MLGSADSLALISSYGADWHEKHKADLIFHEKGMHHLKRRWNICPHHRRCRQRWHEPVQVFFHPFAHFLTTMALSFIGYVLFIFYCSCCRSRRVENLYRSSLILMFDTGAFSLVLIQLPRRSSFRMVGVCPRPWLQTSF